MTAPDVRRVICDWIVRTSATDVADALREDTPLFEHGILSSFDVVELILLIEELRGAPVDPDRIEPAALRDVDSICRAFFAPEVTR